MRSTVLTVLQIECSCYKDNPIVNAIMKDSELKNCNETKYMEHAKQCQYTTNMNGGSYFCKCDNTGMIHVLLSVSCPSANEFSAIFL